MCVYIYIYIYYVLARGRAAVRPGAAVQAVPIYATTIHTPPPMNVYSV